MCSLGTPMFIPTYFISAPDYHKQKSQPTHQRIYDFKLRKQTRNLSPQALTFKSDNSLPMPPGLVSRFSLMGRKLAGKILRCADTETMKLRVEPRGCLVLKRGIRQHLERQKSCFPPGDFGGGWKFDAITRADVCRNDRLIVIDYKNNGWGRRLENIFEGGYVSMRSVLGFDRKKHFQFLFNIFFKKLFEFCYNYL